MERAHIRCIPFNPVVPLLSLVMKMCIRDRFGIRMRVLYDGLAVNQVRWGTMQP